eukprot:8856501-Lingulodinium_polyedra.AAC.1
MAPRPMMATETNWPTRAASCTLARQAETARRRACANTQALAGRGDSQPRRPPQRAPHISATSARS